MVDNYNSAIKEINDIYSNTLNNINKNEKYSENINSNSSCNSVDIEGFLFFADEISPDNSYSKREYKRTSIMGGGEFVSRGVYQPKEFSFNSSLEVDPSEPYIYDRIFSLMENKPGGCEIISPYTGHFWGEVSINKTHPEASPHIIEVEVKIKEIPKANANLYGDGIIDYPPVDKLSDNAISIKGADENKSKVKDLTNKLKVDYQNPYNTNGYTNENSYYEGYSSEE